MNIDLPVTFGAEVAVVSEDEPHFQDPSGLACAVSRIGSNQKTALDLMVARSNLCITTCFNKIVSLINSSRQHWMWAMAVYD